MDLGLSGVFEKLEERFGKWSSTVLLAALMFGIVAWALDTFVSSYVSGKALWEGGGQDAMIGLAKLVVAIFGLVVFASLAYASMAKHFTKIFVDIEIKRAKTELDEFMKEFMKEERDDVVHQLTTGYFIRPRLVRHHQRHADQTQGGSRIGADDAEPGIRRGMDDSNPGVAIEIPVLFPRAGEVLAHETKGYPPLLDGARDDDDLAAGNEQRVSGCQGSRNDCSDQPALTVTPRGGQNSGLYAFSERTLEKPFLEASEHSGVMTSRSGRGEKSTGDTTTNVWRLAGTPYGNSRTVAAAADGRTPYGIPDYRKNLDSSRCAA